MVSVANYRYINELNSWSWYIANSFIDFQIYFSWRKVTAFFNLCVFDLVCNLILVFNVASFSLLNLITERMLCWTKQKCFCCLKFLTDVFRAYTIWFRKSFWNLDVFQFLCFVLLWYWHELVCLISAALSFRRSWKINCLLFKMKAYVGKEVWKNLFS